MFFLSYDFLSMFSIYTRNWMNIYCYTRKMTTPTTYISSENDLSFKNNLFSPKSKSKFCVHTSFLHHRF